MFFYEGQSCPVCGERFGEKDDVVACPVCGAPHHRDCWKQEGHCHFAADHGTERQWAKDTATQKVETPPTRNCPNCGNKNPEFAEFCARCGRKLESADWQSYTPPPHQVHQYTPPTNGHGAPFQPPFGDPFGGVPRSEQISGVPVELVAQVVGQNSAYYIPRFLSMSRSGRKVSWNWAAFLLPSNWLLFRKNVLWGTLCFLFSGAMEIFFSFAGSRIQSYQLTPLADEKLQLYVLIYLIASFAVTGICVAMGLFGNYLYMQQVLRKARKLMGNPDLQYNQSFFVTGGTSIGAAIAPEILVFLVQYVFLLFTQL